MNRILLVNLGISLSVLGLIACGGGKEPVSTPTSVVLTAAPDIADTAKVTPVSNPVPTATPTTVPPTATPTTVPPTATPTTVPPTATPTTVPPTATPTTVPPTATPTTVPPTATPTTVPPTAVSVDETTEVTSETLTVQPEIDLVDAVIQGDIDIVLQHIEAGTDINESFYLSLPGTPGYGGSALHLAVALSDEITELLIENGADIEIKAKDDIGGTPLHWAAVVGNSQTVIRLVEVGANINALEGNGFTPLDAVILSQLADMNTKVELSIFLRDQGGTSNMLSVDVLIYGAIVEGNIEAGKKLIDAGVDINATFVTKALESITGLPEDEGLGGSPLHVAVLIGNREFAELLLENGADKDIRAKDVSGGTPLTWAAFLGQIEMVKFLVEAGSDVNASDNYGYTPLDAAMGSPLLNDQVADAIAEYLLDNGASVGE